MQKACTEELEGSEHRDSDVFFSADALVMTSGHNRMYKPKQLELEIDMSIALTLFPTICT
jgi:hypothetical protein